MSISVTPLFVAASSPRPAPPDDRTQHPRLDDEGPNIRFDPRWPPDDGRWIELREFNVILPYL